MGLGFSFFTARGGKNAYGNKDFADYFSNEGKERKTAPGSKGQSYPGGPSGLLSTTHPDGGDNKGVAQVANAPDI